MELRVVPVSDEKVVLYEEGHRYVVGEGITERNVPSYSAVMKSAGLSTDYSEVDPTHLAFRAAVGTNVHSMIEQYLAIAGDEEQGEHPDQLVVRASAPHFEAFLKWRKKHELITFVSEVPAYQPDLGYCTTADWIGLLDGELWVLDYKSTYKIARNVGYQTMAQQKCYRFTHKDGVAISPWRGALHLPKRGPAEIVPFVDDKWDARVVEASAICWKAKAA